MLKVSHIEGLRKTGTYTLEGILAEKKNNIGIGESLRIWHLQVSRGICQDPSVCFSTYRRKDFKLDGALVISSRMEVSFQL